MSKDIFLENAMKLGDRFYRAMSEWSDKVSSRYLATEENAYELYWFNQVNRFYGPEVDTEIYCAPGSVSYLTQQDNCYIFVITLARKWRNPTHSIWLYFDRETGKYIKMKRSLKRKLRDDEREELRYLAEGYFNQLHEWNFVED